MSFTSHYISLLIIVLTMAPLSSCQFDLIRTLLGLTHIQGTLYCTLNGNMIYGLLTPTFPNAAVEMHCGTGGTVISSVKSDATGRFSMLLDAPQLLLSFLLNNCSLVVTTPLVNCNGAMPSFGALASPLQLIGNTFLGLFNVTNIIPHFGVVSEIGVKEIPRRRFSWQDCGGEIMDGNKDEGLRCIRIAEEAIASGNKERALGFIKIARRLNRSLRVDELLTAWEEIDSGLPSSSSDEKRAGKVESVFGWVKHVDGLSGERNYAIEHVQLVRQINATKDYYRILGVDNASSAE